MSAIGLNSAAFNGATLVVPAMLADTVGWFLGGA
jgi:hypothetical protein